MKRMLCSGLLLPAFCPLLTQSVFAQDTVQNAIIRGRLVNRANKEPAPAVQVSMPYLKLLTTTNGEGFFTFSEVKPGVQTIVLGGEDVTPDTFRINVSGRVIALKDYFITPIAAGASQAALQIPVIALEDNDVSTPDEGVKTQNVSGLLTASGDPFTRTAAFVLGRYHFQPRGYDRSSQEALINGALMNDVETGDASWNQWGGLNDVFRVSNSTYGLQPSEYTFGGANGSVYFNATAADQRTQTRLTYSLADRQYNNRMMLTQSSGLRADGWAYSVSVSRRWANEAYVPGTFYDGYAYYASVSKRIRRQHTISLTTFGAPTTRGKASPTYREAFDLAGDHFYNPDWGYQNGVKRNARVAHTNQPVALLSYEYVPDEKLRWNTVAGFQFGKNQVSGIDWYNASDPRPDYYGYLPGYYINTSKPDAYRAAQNAAAFISDHQIKWDEFYAENRLNTQHVPNANGTASGDVGHRSVYVLGNDVDNSKKFVFNSNLERVLDTHITLAGGASFTYQNTESYRQLGDLLGGDFFLNINQFAERDNPGDTVRSQFDANHPNGVIRKGDKYNYDYIIRYSKALAWAQSVFTYNHLDLFIAANAGYNTFSREGLFRNGLFADGSESFGRSATPAFTTYGIKGGATYKLNGRNYLFLNAALSADAPEVDNTFYSIRVRNAVVDDPVTQKTYTAEGGYLLRAPKANARVVGYITDMHDGTQVQRYYREGSGSASDFVDYVLQHINTRSIGAELALEYKLTTALTVTGVAALGQSFYTNNPDVTYHSENVADSSLHAEQVFIKNYYLATGPQIVYSLGLRYTAKSYWNAGINASYLDHNYVSVSAPRRTESIVDLLEPGSTAWHNVVDQEKLPAAFVVDVSGGKSFRLSRISKRLPKGTTMQLNAGISNVLGNRNIIAFGYENLRADHDYPNKFATKYYYGYGRNFFVNLSLKF